MRTLAMIAVLAATVASASAAEWEDCTKGKGQAAIEACTAMLGQGDDATAYLERGATYYVLRDYKRAEADLTQAIKINPEGPRGWKTRGKARMWLKNYSGALEDLNKSLSLWLMDTEDFRYQKEDAEVWKIIAELKNGK